jgi:hypothetical protein
VNGSVLILAHAADSGAESVAALMRRKLGAGSVRVVRPEMLSLASWSHRVDSRGTARTSVTIARGSVIEDEHVAAVLNRIRYLPVPRFHRSSVKDREYAGAEMQALVASWLAAFGDRVVHVVREHPWVTPTLPRQQWAAAAAACGLPIAVRTISTSPRARRLRETHQPVPSSFDVASSDPVGTVLVAGDRIEGSLAATFGVRCFRAARWLRFPLVEFRFAIDSGTTALVDATVFPSLAEPWATALTADLLESVARRAS